MKTWHIHIEGVVQGVGFRPFVYALAHEHSLGGQVSNTTDGVHITFNAESSVALEFRQQLLDKAPRLSQITHIDLRPATDRSFSDFRIVHEAAGSSPSLLLTPDFAICGDCRTELYQAGNRRAGYPFITCTNCGPRFSIVQRLPYDRVNTTMGAFDMCSTCSEEYHDPTDRRYYSQTNSCQDCGIQLSLYDAEQRLHDADQKTILAKVVQSWEAGKIIAIKGIGGYLLTCDAYSPTAVAKLRLRKHRPGKPFALMYPGVEALEGLEVDGYAGRELGSPAAPIVLLETMQPTASPLSDTIAPHLSQVGVMLPYTPLYDLLLQQFGRPIVATSGNISGAPIIYQDEKALQELTQLADYVLTNNRAIVVPQDDSVVRFSPFHRQRIVLRRSRGIAPTYINARLRWPTDQTMLAMGAMLKSTFSLLQQGKVYISQYLGGLSHFDAQQSYQRTVQHFLELFHTQPQTILVDQHPDYPSGEYGRQLALQTGARVEAIQHHLAHFGAILGEHQLIDTTQPVLGVIWDGTGLGDDGQIWGGEFFRYGDYRFNRCAHFDYFSVLSGDKMAQEPRLSALSVCHGVRGSEALLRPLFNATEWRIYQWLLDRDRPLQTSSIGRLFDAIAALLGLVAVQTYEGEAAMRLEALATGYCRQHGREALSGYLDGIDKASGATERLLSGVLSDIRAGRAKDFIAAQFHFSLVQLVGGIAHRLHLKHIAFSGGVFQNGLLVDLLQDQLAADFQLYFHQQLSPNDENISFGQLVVHQINQQRLSFHKHKQTDHVLSNSR